MDFSRPVRSSAHTLAHTGIPTLSDCGTKCGTHYSGARAARAEIFCAIDLLSNRQAGQPRAKQSRLSNAGWAALEASNPAKQSRLEAPGAIAYKSLLSVRSRAAQTAARAYYLKSRIRSLGHGQQSGTVQLRVHVTPGPYVRGHDHFAQKRL